MDETELKSLATTTNHSDYPDTTDLPLLKSTTTSSSAQKHHNEQQHTPTLSDIEEMEKNFSAFVRHDTYGPMGRGEVPFTEKFLIGLSIVTLVPLRVVVGMSILVVYYLVCKVCTMFSTPHREGDGEGEEVQLQQEDYAHLGGWRREVIVHCGRFLSRALLFTFGFYWISEASRVFEDVGDNNLNDKNANSDQLGESERPGVVVSNHVSYVDILFHMSSSFPSFVAKRSVGKLPLIGLISKCLGCVYVQREDKSSDFKGVSGVVTERIQEAHDSIDAPLMLIFPEGTTTNGNFLLPFKTGAFIAGAPVLPVILRYPYQRFSPAWDSISGVRHVILLLCQFVNYMEVMRLPVYYPSKEEKGDPKLYANNVRKLMADEGGLILSDIGLPEKRIYHAALNGNNSLRSVYHQKTN